MMVCNDARPKTACSSRAYSMLRVWQGDNCNGGGVVADASMSALKSPLRCGLIACVPISHAACARPPNSALTARSCGHRPSNGAFGGLGDRLWLVLQALFDALSAAAAMHSIRTIHESTLLPFAACERVY